LKAQRNCANTGKISSSVGVSPITFKCFSHELQNLFSTLEKIFETVAQTFANCVYNRGAIFIPLITRSSGGFIFIFSCDTGTPVKCTFDSGLCSGWSQATSDRFDWTVQSGKTPSRDTGPSADHSGSGKLYLDIL